MANFHLSKLLDMESIKDVHNAFNRMTGLASVLTDESGTPLTEGYRSEEFCYKLTRNSPIGRARCESCDRMGAKRAMRSGRAEVYTCHAGLCDFAAPIIVDGRFMGALVGGQVLTEEPDEGTVRATARELGINEDDYVEAIRKVPLMEREKIEEAAGFLSVLATIFSTMAYNNYVAQNQNRELAKMYRMKQELLSAVNMNLHKPLQEILFLANSMSRMALPDEAAEKLRRLERMSRTVIDALADVMANSEITRTDSDIVETEYDLRKLCEGLENTYRRELADGPLKFVLTVDEDVPTDLFGDATRIRHILINLINNSVQYTKEGSISLHISQRRTTYGLMIIFEIADTGIGMSENQTKDIQRLFDSVNESQTIGEDMLTYGLGITSQLVNAVYGCVHVESTPGVGSVFTVTVPQMQAKE